MSMSAASSVCYSMPNSCPFIAALHRCLHIGLHVCLPCIIIAEAACPFPCPFYPSITEVCEADRGGRLRRHAADGPPRA